MLFPLPQKTEVIVNNYIITVHYMVIIVSKFSPKCILNTRCSLWAFSKL